MVQAHYHYLRGAIVKGLEVAEIPMSCRNLSMRADSFACKSTNNTEIHNA